MELRDFGPEDQAALEQMLGYLNFSSGASDAQFLSNLNGLFDRIESIRSPKEKKSKSASSAGEDQPAAWETAISILRSKVDELRGKSPAFSDTTQVDAVLTLLVDDVLPDYLEFHKDLLFHQNESLLFRPLFLGRVIESILSLGTDWSDSERISKGVLKQLNDFVGYRPVAVLESRRCEPYPHEMVRPIPLYIRGVGVSAGPYTEVVEQALDLLKETDPDIARMAFFNFDHLEELAVDPRAYDFDHPVNKRPNYHFGQWDPHAINKDGNYHRFVIQQVTLNALMERAKSSDNIPIQQRIAEAAAVLAGTILMASGVSGASPSSHDSETSLGTLLPTIAHYRDAFYDRLITRLPDKHRERLEEEAVRLRQPFAAARQHLNAQLTRRRAAQLEHVRLASVFARMGYTEAAQRQINAVPVASARMICQIDCNLTAIQAKIKSEDLAEAAKLLQKTRQVLTHGIECGAVIDPWNILGFDGNFSLFPSLENSVHDHRVDQIIEVVDEIFEMYSRLWSAAAAADDRPVCEQIALDFRDATDWWRQFAVHEMSAIDFPDPQETYRAAESVAGALRDWHKGGEAAGDIRFWAPHVANFETSRAYHLVIQMLLERSDFVAARGLLVSWLNQADSVPLEHGEASFLRLATLWLSGMLRIGETEPDEIRWKLVRKFFDYIEANAGEFWQVPTFAVGDDFELKNDPVDDGPSTDPMDDEFEGGMDDDGFRDEEDDLFGAAYEDVVYRDSTDDGMESSLFDTGGSSNDQLDEVHDSIVSRLVFINGLSRLRRTTAIVWGAKGHTENEEDRLDSALMNWWKHTHRYREELMQLLEQVSRYRLARPGSDFMAMADFDRQRMIRESLLEHIIVCNVELGEAELFTIAGMPDSETRDGLLADLSDEDKQVVSILTSMLRRDAEATRENLETLLETIRNKPVLYVPLARGGNPRTIIGIRSRQQLLRTLLSWLPRLNLLTETRQLIESIRKIERAVPAGPGSVTEFDDLFEVGYRALVKAVIRSSDDEEDLGLSEQIESDEETDGDATLVSCLETMTESMLVTWLSHSRTLRLSVLEKIKDNDSWQKLVAFIKRYGRDLFTQQFLNLANIRSILYQGVETWFQQLEELPSETYDLPLLEELDTGIPRDDAVKWISLTLEAVVENYAEYRDYNSTTTQSDRGDLLFNLLDFLRLLSNYERVAWNLRPVIVSHELLVRNDCNAAAQMWRRALAERISEESDRYLKRLAKLQKTYAMRLSTVADRLGERFLRPMIIDRMRALVKPAMERTSKTAFELLEEETALLMREPTGVGFDPPTWLLALEEEVARVRGSQYHIDEKSMFDELLDPQPMSVDEVQSQLEAWDRGGNDLA